MFSFETLSFYRGLSNRYEVAHPTVHATRMDRQPRDTRQNIHDVADNWFFERFGVRYRSQAVFVSSDTSVAAAYAASPDHIVRVIPLGAYKYCWSSQLSDLLEIGMHNPDIEDFKSDLVNAHYKEDCLDDAHRLGHEVMIFCESYVCIPVNSVVQVHK
ncbi:hypothetical protein [Pseudomonas frederiksbergensis]|uniref:hypothetical protein n=1 Tax=Pseudomonas frederiksbergensis TaxID=104087 RepID=UPI003D1E6FF3